MSDIMKEFVEKLSASICSEMEAAHMDALRYGTGFIAIGASLDFKCISYEEVLKKAEHISHRAHLINPPSNGDEA